MKRRAKTTTLASVLLIVFLMVFLVHQITLSTISRASSSTNSTTTFDNQVELKTRHYLVRQNTIQSDQQSQSSQPLCNRSNYRYDLCTIKSQTLLDPTISTLSLINPTLPLPPQREKVRPYPRKWENATMSLIKEVTITTSPVRAHCNYQHEAPALVFSTGGYTGNLFHDFNDGFIPLFITIRSLFPQQSPVLVIANCRNWWLDKYREILPQFSPYPIINLDNDTATHCFPSATIGLISHGYMTIDPKLSPSAENMLNFRALLGNAYGHGLVGAHGLFPRANSWRPRLVLVSRTGNGGRVILNQAAVIQLAKQTGFEVEVFQPNQRTLLSAAYSLINTSHVMFGVHGAALTHSLFLRPGSVFIQVVPIGIDWLAETCFGKPARDMGLEYMEYRVGAKESSLVEKYGEDHLVLTNPKAFTQKTFSHTKNTYLNGQDVRLDLERVGEYLGEAYEKAMRFMVKEG